MKIDLSSKRVIVTGGSRGIGKGIAIALNDCGAKVVVHYNKLKDEAETLIRGFSNGYAIQANLESAKAPRRFFDQAVETLGGLDVIVNNAGIAFNSPIQGKDEDWVESWDKTMNINLRATGVLCMAAAQHFEAHGGGRIVNIASRAAFRGDTMDYLAYAASKGGVVSLTKSLARGLGKKNIKAFVIAPGFVKTDMAQEFMDAYGEDYALNDIALNQLTEPKDIGPMVAFLASGLGDHATGTTIDINAGSYVH